MATGNQVGVVSATKGEVFARNADGQMRRLAVGDAVYEKETIITASGSAVEITPLDGPVLNVAEQQTLVLDDQVFMSVPDSVAGGINPLSSSEAVRIIQNNNPDFNAQLDEDAAAAGLNGGDGGGGSNFVQLLRVAEGVQGTGFSFGAGQAGEGIDLQDSTLFVPDPVTLSVNLLAEEESALGGAGEKKVISEIGNNELDDGNNYTQSGLVDWPSGSGTIASVEVGGLTFSTASGSAAVYFDADGQVQTGGEGAAAQLVVNSDGSYTFTVLGAFNHAAVQGENNVDLPLVTFNGKGSTGGQVTVNLELSVQDDAPEAAPTGAEMTARLEEDSVPLVPGGGSPIGNDESDSDSYSYTTGSLSDLTVGGANGGPVNWGADGFGSVTSITVGAHQIAVPAADEGGPGSTTVYFDENGVWQDSGADAAAQLTVTSDGSYTVTVLGAMNHSSGAGENWLDLPTIQITAVDGDGDSKTVPLNISVQDDVPLVNAGKAAVSILESKIQTQWSDGSDDATGPAEISGNLTDGFVSMGADGLAAQGAFRFVSNAIAQLEALGLQSKASAAEDGPWDAFWINGTKNPAALTYSISSADANGWVTLTATEPDATLIEGGPADTSNIVFELKLNTNTGDYEFRLYDELVNNLGDTNAGIAINFGSIINATDRDGDSVNLDGAFVINVVDDVPLAVADFGSVTEDSTPLRTVSGDVLSNDASGADESLSFVSWANISAQYGTFVDRGNGDYTYTVNNNNPAVNALGLNQTLTEMFTYSIKDGEGDVQTATLTITINGANDAPTTAVASGTGVEDSGSDIAIVLSGADVDTGDSVASFRITNLPSGGTLYANEGHTQIIHSGDTVLATGNSATVYFVPNANYAGNTSFQYAAIDTHNLQDASAATATITVTAVNDAPTATITPASYSASEQTNLNLHGTGLSIGDIDAGSGTVTATLSVGEGVLTATEGNSGADVSGSGTSTLTITGTVTQINNLLGGVDTNGWWLGSAGTIVYNDNTDNPSASTTLTLTVNDGGNTGGSALSASDTAIINIAAINDAPTTAVASGTGVEDSGSDIAIVLSGADVDTGDSVASFRITNLPSGGTLYANEGHTQIIHSGDTVTATGNSATVYFVPNANYAGNTSFQYAAIDTHNLQDASAATATITITGDAGPTAIADTIITAINNNEVFTIPQWALTANDLPGTDGSPVFGSIASYDTGNFDDVSSSATEVIVDTDNRFDPGDQAAFSYVVNDGSADSNATGTVTVIAVSNANITGGNGAEIIVDNNDGHLISAGNGNDIVFGNGGNDTLDGQAGVDVLFGGGGNDTLRLDLADLPGTAATVYDGGAGTDVLSFTGAGEALDLTAIGQSKIAHIETVDLTGTGNNSLTLNAQDVLDIGDRIFDPAGSSYAERGALQVNGNAGDSLTLKGNWHEITPSNAPNGYDVYASGTDGSNETAYLIVSEAINKANIKIEP